MHGIDVARMLCQEWNDENSARDSTWPDTRETADNAAVRVPKLVKLNLRFVATSISGVDPSSASCEFELRASHGMPYTCV